MTDANPACKPPARLGSVHLRRLLYLLMTVVQQPADQTFVPTDTAHISRRRLCEMWLLMQGPLRSDVNYTPIICYGQRHHCSPRGANCDSLLLISFFQRMSTDRSTAAGALFFYRYLLPETNNFCFTAPEYTPNTPPPGTLPRAWLYGGNCMWTLSGSF